METLKFKTTINCGGCIAAVSPRLNSIEDIKSWEVDINDPEKILTVESENLKEKDIIQLIEQLGFKAEALPV